MNIIQWFFCNIEISHDTQKINTAEMLCSQNVTCSIDKFFIFIFIFFVKCYVMCVLYIERQKRVSGRKGGWIVKYTEKKFDKCRHVCVE